MPDQSTRHTPANPAYHEHGAPTRAVDNEKGLQP